MMANYAKTSGEVSALEALLHTSPVATRALLIVETLVDEGEPLSRREIVARLQDVSEGETDRGARTALQFASKAGLATPAGRSGWRATGAGRMAVRRMRRGDR